MAEIIEWYIPRKHVPPKWKPPRGQVIEFPLRGAIAQTIEYIKGFKVKDTRRKFESE